MRGIHLFLILVTLPFFVALGHDIYLFVTHGGSVDTLEQTVNAEEGDPGIKSLFATAGYIWTQYSPDTYKTVVEATEGEGWNTINAILAQKAVVLGAVFAGFFYVLAFLLKILGVGKAEEAAPKFGSGRKSSVNTSERMKYKNVALICYILNLFGPVAIVAPLVSLCMLGPSKGTISRSHFNNLIYITVVSIIFGLIGIFALIPLLNSEEPTLVFGIAGLLIAFSLYVLYRWLFGLIALLRGETFKEN